METRKARKEVGVEKFDEVKAERKREMAPL